MNNEVNNAVKRKRGRPPKVKPQAKADAIIQNILTAVVANQEPAPCLLSGFHGLRAVPKPIHQERNRDK